MELPEFCLDYLKAAVKLPAEYSVELYEMVKGWIMRFQACASLV